MWRLPTESDTDSPAMSASACPVSAGPLNERGVYWDCNDRPCAVCGAAAGSPLQRYCSLRCQERDGG